MMTKVRWNDQAAHKGAVVCTLTMGNSQAPFGEFNLPKVNARCLNLTGYLAIFSLVHLEPIVSGVEWTALRYPKG